MPGKISRTRTGKPEEVESLPTSKGPGRVSRETAPSVELHLLGTFALRGRDRVVASLPKKAQALLAYLAIHAGRAVPREQLADLLWGRSGGEQARRSLRQCLMSVRSALDLLAAKDVLATETDSVMLSSSGVECDGARFVALSRSSKLNELQLQASSTAAIFSAAYKLRRKDSPNGSRSSDAAFLLCCRRFSSGSPLHWRRLGTSTGLSQRLSG